MDVEGEEKDRGKKRVRTKGLQKKLLEQVRMPRPIDTWLAKMLYIHVVLSNISAGVFTWVFVFQIEFYFGDANLQRDRFLGEKIKEHPDGCMYHMFTRHYSRELVFCLCARVFRTSLVHNHC